MLVGSTLLVASSGPGLSINPWMGLTLGILLVVINGFFVAAEFALVKLRPTQVEPLAVAGDRRAKMLQHMIGHLDAYLSASQLGITLASLALGWIGEPAFVWLLEPWISQIPGATPTMVHSVALTFAFTLITILHIVIGELAPKTLAIRSPLPTSMWIAIPMLVFFRVSYPAIWILNHASNGFLALFGVQPVSENELGHSEEELRLLLASTTEDLSAQKRELLDNIFDLSHRIARQIMVPRADVVFLSTNETVPDNLRRARESEHTRFPLCSDKLDDAVGLIHIKDLFRLEQTPDSLQEIARELTFVPETLPLDRLLRRMRTERVHLAAVLDEYGGISGIVTLENVMEEIVGEIQDEFDAEPPELEDLGEGLYRIDGGMLVEEVEEALGVEISDRDEDTIAGVVLSELGRSPETGDEVQVGSLLLHIEEAEGNRIKLLRVTHIPPTSP